MEVIELVLEFEKSRVKFVALLLVGQDRCPVNFFREVNAVIAETGLVHDVKEVLRFVTVAGDDHLDGAVRVFVFEARNKAHEVWVA